MTRRFSPFLVLIFAVLLAARLGAQLPSTPNAAAESWVGKYTSSNLQLEIKPGGSGGLTGVISFDNSVYVASVRAERDKLTGTFRAGANSFPYEATRNGNEVRFVTGGTEYRLQRESTPTHANPLARSGRPTSPAEPPTPDTGQLVQVSLGYSFRLPAGWTSKDTGEGVIILPEGVTFDPSREDNPEVYIAALRNDYDPSEEAQVVKQLSAAFAENGGRGGQRQSMNFGPRSGAGYRWELRDPQSGRVTAFDIYLATEGRRVFVMMAAGEKTRVRSNDAAVRQILSSMALAAATRPNNDGALADATPLAQRWLNKLRGKLVRQFWASQGMSSDKRHWLNADGTYAFKSSSMVSVEVPGAGGLSTGRDGSTGRWAIRDVSGQVFLEVRYDNGNVQRMRITEDNRNWYLNGEKAFAVAPE